MMAPGPLRRLIRRSIPGSAEPISTFEAGGRIPWSSGYGEYKEAMLKRVFGDAALMQTFRTGGALPSGYGHRLDERIVEYPWVLSHLSPGDGLILDAGSTLNKAFLLDHPLLNDRRVLIYTLETDRIALNPRISYLFGDLRDMLLRDASVASIVCISTLEHVGFTYEYRKYSRHNPWPSAEPESFLRALAEFRRVLVPGGELLLTVPFGRAEDHGWLQQFDAAGIRRIKQGFGGTVAAEACYRYHPEAWQVAAPEECADLAYFNVHEGNGFDPDHAAAARAVVCLKLIR